MIAAVVLLLAQALPSEEDRIRAKAPLTESEKKAYSFPVPPAAKPRASYTLAVVPVSFSDRAVADADPAKLFQGPVAEYFAKASGGRFALSCKARAAVTLGVERAKVREKDFEPLAAALGEADGLALVVAGPLGARGTPLWPHKESFRLGEKTVDYIVVPEEAGDRALGIAAHEAMHLLGFPDKYDDEKASVGDACILGTGYASKNPSPPCAECREKLGWTAVADLDPRKPAAVVMEPDLSKSLRIPVNPDGTESLLLEFRDRLFIWHVGGGRKIELVGRYSTPSSDRLTPLSEPSFRGRTIGARPVWITDIRVEEGRAWFRVGPDAPLTPAEERRRATAGRRLGD